VTVLGELFSEIVQLIIGVPFLRDLVVAIETFLPRLRPGAPDYRQLQRDDSLCKGVLQTLEDRNKENITR